MGKLSRFASLAAFGGAMQANALVMLSKANGNEAPHVGLHSKTP